MKQTFLAAFFAACLGFLACYVFVPRTPSGLSVVKESAYDRVMRTQTFRCGFGQWPPYVSKDPTTGQVRGIFHDYMESLGDALHLKIVWAEEFGSGDFMPALRDGRIDGLCAGIWPNASRAREMDFTRPVYYSAMDAYVRADDARFDANMRTIDDPAITIVTSDGKMAGLIAAADFPKAKVMQLPQLAAISEFFMAIAMKKADVTFANPAMFALYDAENPGKLRRVRARLPVRVFGNTIAIDAGQDRLRRMLDTATEELLFSGKIDRILDSYKPATDALLRVQPAYQRGN